MGLAALALAACSTGAELQFADWILPVSEGIPVHEYAPVPRDERDAKAIRLEEDLVIGGEADSTFYSTPAIAVSADGTIYVLDAEDNSVRAFTRDGTLVRKFGGEGQGPGEMERGRAITVAGDQILVADGFSRVRILAYSLDGESISSVQTQESFGGAFHGLADGTFVDSTRETLEDGAVRRIAGRYDKSGNQLSEYLGLTLEGLSFAVAPGDRANAMLRMIQGTIDISAEPAPSAITDGRQVYLLARSQYQVLTTDTEARPLWALRVAWAAPPYEASRQRPHLRAAERAEIDPTVLHFPPLGPAIDDVLVDGRGRLYVYPNPGDQPEEDPYVPIDVFSPDGALIAAGLGPATWTTARGDYVYGWRHDEETDHWYVVRSELTVNRR